MFRSFSFFLLLNFLSQASASDIVTVFAASSLTLPLNEVATQYQQQSKQKVTISYGASSSLARQLLHDAPAELYISANLKWMNFIEKKSLIEKKNTWLGNELVLVTAKTNKIPDNFDINDLAQQLTKQYIAISNPSHVPLGIYSKEALTAYDLWDSIVKKAVFTRNARAALALVEREEATFGIVYYSDAIASSLTKIIYQFSEEKHSPILYSKSLLKGVTANAQAFYQYLESEAAKNIFLKYGFTLTEK